MAIDDCWLSMANGHQKTHLVNVIASQVGRPLNCAALPTAARPPSASVCIRVSACVSILMLLSVLPPSLEAAILLATCSGLHQLADDRPEVDCDESYVLTDPQGSLISGYSTARANLNCLQLDAAAAGGHIRDTAYHGREAVSKVLDTFTVIGNWQDSLPVTVSMRVRYRLDGFGESRLDTVLQLSPAKRGLERNRANLRVLHTKLGGAFLFNVDSGGNYRMPGDGRYPPMSFIELWVTQMVEPHSPVVDLRAELHAYPLPTIGGLEPTIFSLVNAQATIRVSSPCPVEMISDSGRDLALENPGEKMEGLAPTGDPSWTCGSE